MAKPATLDDCRDLFRRRAANRQWDQRESCAECVLQEGNLDLERMFLRVDGLADHDLRHSAYVRHSRQIQ